MKKLTILSTAIMLLLVNPGDAQLPHTAIEYKGASASTQDEAIIVSTGKVRGTWKWTGKGFVSTGFQNLESGKEWADMEPEHPADWDLRIFDGKAELLSLVSDISSDEGFTNEHIRVAAEIEYTMSDKHYPGSSLIVRYEIWGYPGAPGLRTQLYLKGKGAWFAPGIAGSNDYLVDYLPVSTTNLVRHTVGFYNNHDGRNEDSLDFVESKVYSNPLSGTEIHEDASILFLYEENEGLGLVKESHKVVNKPGINTGFFACGEKGIASTGWGLALADIVKDSFQPCWASWRICWKGGEDEKQLALKVFDRLRYPVSEEEIILMTNVWGGGQHVASAKEENIIREIKSSGDLGIDVVQIDAGWEDRSDSDCEWRISEETYPNGFEKVMNVARENKVSMGIWNRAESVNKFDSKLITLNDMGFQYYKIDIGTWNTYRMLHELSVHARELKKHSGHKAVINWDVTHKGLRVGYLYNREYGILFLQNRRLKIEGRNNPSARYIPTRILKDQWMGAKYLNLNKIQFNVQTTEFVPPEHSNARLYGDVYSFALAMMSSPLFFTETWRYSAEDREAVKEIISIYKKYREDLFKGYVFSLGERPDDAAWAGFQNFHPGENHGYITLFREIDNQENRKSIQLKFIKSAKLQIENLMTGEQEKIKVDENGFTEFKIKDPASFKFYKYTLL